MEKIVISESIYNEFEQQVRLANFNPIVYNFAAADLSFYKPKALFLDKKDYENTDFAYNIFLFDEVTDYITLESGKVREELECDVTFIGQPDYNLLSLLEKYKIKFKIFGPSYYRVPQYIGLLYSEEVADLFYNSNAVLLCNNYSRKDLLNVVYAGGIPVSLNQKETDFTLVKNINCIQQLQDIIKNSYKIKQSYAQKKESLEQFKVKSYVNKLLS